VKKPLPCVPYLLLDKPWQVFTIWRAYRVYRIRKEADEHDDVQWIADVRADWEKKS